jgi:hypothetical protein
MQKTTIKVEENGSEYASNLSFGDDTNHNGN